MLTCLGFICVFYSTRRKLNQRPRLLANVLPLGKRVGALFNDCESPNAETAKGLRL